MLAEVKKIYQTFNYIIMSAAVADFKPKEIRKGKIKKENTDNYSIELERTTDILEYLGQNKKGFKLAGFALETENEIENANRKLKNKNLDLIVLNNPLEDGAGFGTDTNIATIIDKEFNEQKLEKMSKFDLANIILDKLTK